MVVRVKRQLARAVAAMLAAAAPAVAAPSSPDAPQPFRVGMVSPPGENFSRIERAFAAALGMRVEIVVVPGYAELIEAQIGRRIDYALYSAPAYAAAAIRCECLRPLAAPLAADGAAGLRSVLIVRRRTDALRGAPLRVAVGPGDSLATRLAPLALWEGAAAARAQGLLVEAASAGEAEAMFLRGEVDGFFGWVPARGNDDDPASAGGSMARLRAAGLDRGDYEAGWLSPLLPHGPHAVRDDMPEERVAAILSALLRGGGFATVSADDYAATVRALRALDEPGG